MGVSVRPGHMDHRIENVRGDELLLENFDPGSVAGIGRWLGGKKWFFTHGGSNRGCELARN